MFGEYFRTLRKNKNITQKQIAEAIGKTPMLISGIETGKNGPFSEEDLEIVSVVLNLDQNEKTDLMKEALKAKGKLPQHLLSYAVMHDEVFLLLETMAVKNLGKESLLRILKIVEEDI